MDQFAFNFAAGTGPGVPLPEFERVGALHLEVANGFSGVGRGRQ
jgi:hypothetical protein